MTSTTGATMPRIAKFTHKKDLPFREYTLVLTPTGGEKNYTSSDIVSFRIALGNDKLKCIYGPQTYGTFNIVFAPSANMTTGNIVRFDGSANSIFSRVTLTSNGGVLEDFNKCNVYIPIVYDLTTDPNTRSSYYSFFGNFEAEQGVVTNYIASVTTGGTSLTAATKTLNVANAPRWC